MKVIRKVIRKAGVSRRTTSALLFAGTALLLLLAAGVEPSAPAQGELFEIALPEINIAPTAEPQLAIPSTNINQIQIHILRPLADRVDYGQIFARLNGASTAGIYGVAPSDRGKVLRMDLSSLPGFKLVPGRNTIEIWVNNQQGRTYYGSFILTTTANRRKEFGYQFAAGSDPRQQVPPELALLEPEGEIVLPAGRNLFQIKIAGVATAVSSVKQITVGGRPAVLKRGPQVTLRKLGLPNESNRVFFEVNYAVAAGMTRIPVEATDALGNRTQLSIPVRTASEARPEEWQGRRIALIVGISKFKHQDGWISDLQFAHVDAQAVADFLQTPGGGRFRPEDMVVLTNEQATLSGFREGLREVAGKVKSEDLVFIFLATHGGPDEKARQNLYFILHDTQYNRLAETGMAMKDLQTYLQQNVRAKRLIMVVDTCHSAGLVDTPTTRGGGGNNLANLYVEKLLFGEEGRAVITASDVNESSREGKKWGQGHGVFTHFLLQGLQGQADANADRFVTLGELFSFVRRQVRAETQFDQNPRLLVGTNENLKLAAVTSSAPIRGRNQSAPVRDLNKGASVRGRNRNTLVRGRNR